MEEIIRLEDINLFELGQQYFREFIDELAQYGIEVSPKLELRPGTGILCYYDLEDGNIYLSVPDFSDPMGRLQSILLRSLLSCETKEDLVHFFRLVIPWMISHEMAHHLRQHYGLFGKNLWQEEQIANQLAIAAIRRRLTLEEKAYAEQFLKRAIDGMASTMESKNIAFDSYYDVLNALSATQQIGQTETENIKVIEKLFSVNAEDLLINSGRLSLEQTDRLEQRQQLIDSINDQYASDIAKYLYYHMGWLYIDLTSRESHYIDEFARLHLNRAAYLPPAGNNPEKPTVEQIQACFKAYMVLQQTSSAGSHHFYKRYRELLLQRLQSDDSFNAQQIKKDAPFLLENWEAQEFDPLNYVVQLAPPKLRSLFPNVIIENFDTLVDVDNHLPFKSDQRLWDYIILREHDDVEAANTLHRLEALDKTDIYRGLPADDSLELVQMLCRVSFEEGDVVMWEGDVSNDVYILINGNLEVFVTEAKEETRVGMIGPGQVIGEMAFFTHAPRSATVRTLESAECYVLKGSDLYLFAYKHPSILMKMSTALAHRLATMVEQAPAHR